MAEHDLSGAVLDGRYQVIEPIAEGAMGSVYRGERLKLGKAVAIKIMHDALPDELASRQRFEREAKLMARLEHPHVVSVIDFGLHDDKPFLVMDLIRGTSLQQHLDKVTRVEPARAIELVRQVLSGLGHAHELGIVHRDIKPANIMLSQKTGLGEQVHILDFGLARPASESAKLTTGIVVGTPNYMAPEQIKGGDIDGRTDLYAVGVLLFELLTGEKPFSADDPLAVVRKHMNQPPPTLAAAAPGIEFGDLEAVVARALAKSPADRFPNAAAMSTALEKVANKSGARKLSEMMGRAVPKTNPPSPRAAEVATASGWEVPSDQSRVSPATGAAVTNPMSNLGSAPAVANPMANVGSAPANAAASHPMTNVGSAPATTIGSAAGPSANVGLANTANVGSAPATTIGSAAGPSANAGLANTANVGSEPATTIGSAAGPSANAAVPNPIASIGSAPTTPGRPASDRGAIPTPMGKVGSAPLGSNGPVTPHAISAPFAHIDSDTESGRVPTYPVVERPATSPIAHVLAASANPASGAASGSSTSGPVSGAAGAGGPSGTFGTPGPVSGTFGTPGPVSGTFGTSGPVSGAAGAPSNSPVSGTFGTSGPVSGAVVRADGGQGASGPMSGVPSIDDSQAQTSIAINAVGSIPPTRGRATDRPIPQIPLTRRQLMLAGGGLVLLLLIIIAAARGGGGARANTVTDAAVAQAHNDATPDDPIAPALARASDLYSNGDLDSALGVVLKARRQHPDSAQLAFLAGKIYFAKLYWTDGIKSFRDAIRLDPAYRNDPELAKIVLRGFITTPDIDSRIDEFLRLDIGETAKPLLEETAKDHPTASIRARANAELKRFK